MFIPNVVIDNINIIRELNPDIAKDQEIRIVELPDDINIKGINSVLDSPLKNSISRRDLKDFPPINGIKLPPREPLQLVPCTKQLSDALRQYLIFIMIWGKGYRNISRVAKALNLNPSLLCKVTTECYYGLFLQAFKTLTSDVMGIGPSFASKLLFFYCYHFNATVKPLIWDVRVILALRSMDWPTENIDIMAYCDRPRKSAEAYGQYLILLHNWAAHLNVTAEQIEYFLWKFGKVQGI
jgi:hypothetical protein